jgi:hypothetical protein
MRTSGEEKTVTGDSKGCDLIRVAFEHMERTSVR